MIPKNQAVWKHEADRARLRAKIDMVFIWTIILVSYAGMLYVYMQVRP